MKVLRRKALGIVVLAAAAALVGAAGVALATTQIGADETLQACVNDVTGVMRLDGSCRVGEHPVVWNIQGQQGEPGAAASFRRVEAVQDVSGYVPPSGPGESALSLTASCRTDEQVVGGGALGSLHLVLSDGTVFDRYGFVKASWPSSDHEWSAYFGGWLTLPDQTLTIKVWAICAT